MTKRFAIPLLVLGVGGLGLGVWLLSDSNQFHYDADGSQTAVIVCAVASILLGLGIAKLTKVILWPIVIVLGMAYPVYGWHAAAKLDADKKAHEAFEAETAKTLAVVCEGTAVPSAAPLAAHGLRPTLMTRLGDDNYLEKLDDAWKPRDVAQAQLVACVKMTKHEIEACMYEGGVRVARNEYTMEITVREAKTANVLGTKTFEGDPPICIDEIKTREGQTTHGDFDGLSPLARDWMPWLTEYVVVK